MKNKKQSGYTLTEIFVVVFIVGILVYISVPIYDKVMQRSDVSDALYNINMLSEAQGKYFVSNGSYSRKISNLKIPLKAEDEEINTTNFNYYMGDPRDDNYCLYAESNVYNYVLAKNYRSQSDISCEGPDCGKISSFVKTGDFDKMCIGNGNGNECNLTCTAPKVLRNCSCVCGISAEDCPANTVFDDANCTCTEQLQCSSPQVAGDGFCGCYIDGTSSPYILNGDGNPQNVAGVFRVKTPCSLSNQWIIDNYALTEDCTCECDQEAQTRQCEGGIEFNEDAECGSCALSPTCVSMHPIVCNEGYTLLDHPCFCEPIVQCPSGQVQVPSESEYNIKARCGCAINKDNPPYVWTNSGNKTAGYFYPGTTHCSNNPDVFSAGGYLNDSCQCVE